MWLLPWPDVTSRMSPGLSGDPLPSVSGENRPLDGFVCVCVEHGLLTPNLLPSPLPQSEGLLCSKTILFFFFFSSPDSLARDQI